MTKQTKQEWLRQELRQTQDKFWEFEYIDIQEIDKGEFGIFVDIIINTQSGYDATSIEFSIESLKEAIKIAEQYKEME